MWVLGVQPQNCICELSRHHVMLEFMCLSCLFSWQRGSSLPESVQDKFSLCLQHTEPFFPMPCYCEENQQVLNTLTQNYTSNRLCKGRKWYVLHYVFLTTYYKQKLFNFLAFNFFFLNHKTFISWILAVLSPCSVTWRIWGWCRTLENVVAFWRVGRDSWNWMMNIEVLCELKHCVILIWFDSIK